MKVLIRISSACSVCGLCVEYCPTGVFQIVETRLDVSQDRCIYCKGCEVVCPVKAISVRALEEGLNISKRKTLTSAK